MLVLCQYLACKKVSLRQQGNYKNSGFLNSLPAYFILKDALVCLYTASHEKKYTAWSSTLQQQQLLGNQAWKQYWIYIYIHTSHQCIIFPSLGRKRSDISCISILGSLTAMVITSLQHQWGLGSCVCKHLLCFPFLLSHSKAWALHHVWSGSYRQRLHVRPAQGRITASVPALKKNTLQVKEYQLCSERSGGEYHIHTTTEPLEDGWSKQGSAVSFEVPIPPKLLGASKCILWNVASFAIVARRF